MFINVSEWVMMIRRRSLHLIFYVTNVCICGKEEENFWEWSELSNELLAIAWLILVFIKKPSSQQKNWCYLEVILGLFELCMWL